MPQHSPRLTKSRVKPAFEKTISSVARTIVRMEESRVCFSDFASKVEHHIRKRAVERLDSLYGRGVAQIQLLKKRINIAA